MVYSNNKRTVLDLQPHYFVGLIAGVFECMKKVSGSSRTWGKLITGANAGRRNAAVAIGAAGQAGPLDRY
jgi:hypothetical protein